MKFLDDPLNARGLLQSPFTSRNGESVDGSTPCMYICTTAIPRLRFMMLSSPDRLITPLHESLLTPEICTQPPAVPSCSCSATCVLDIIDPTPNGGEDSQITSTIHPRSPRHGVSLHGWPSNVENSRWSSCQSSNISFAIPLSHRSGIPFP